MTSGSWPIGTGKVTFPEAWMLSHLIKQSFKVHINTPVCIWGFEGLEVKAAKCIQLIGGRAILQAHSLWPQFTGSFHLFPVIKGKYENILLYEPILFLPLSLGHKSCYVYLKFGSRGAYRLGSTTDGKHNLGKSLHAFEHQFPHLQNE